MNLDYKPQSINQSLLLVSQTVISCKEEETVSDSEDLLRSQNNMINVNGDIIKLENTIQGADLITSGTDVTVECSQVENIIDLKEVSLFDITLVFLSCEKYTGLVLLYL